MSLTMLLRKARALGHLVQAGGPESRVSKRWLLTTSSRLDHEFESSRNYQIETMADLTKIQVGDQIFLWPAGSPIERGLATLSEILNPGHPHQYLYGPTQISVDDVVLDIGACEGSFSALVADRCKRVIAVEPSRQMCSLMAKLFEIRDQRCPMIVECFLGETSSTAYFAEHPSNPGTGKMSFEPIDGGYEVPVTTLDELVETLEEKPTFIKCDAEGAAPLIFAGGENYLKKFRPKLAIASYHTHTEYRELYGFLKGLGYNLSGKGFFFTQGELRVQMLHAW